MLYVTDIPNYRLTKQKSHVTDGTYSYRLWTHMSHVTDIASYIQNKCPKSQTFLATCTHDIHIPRQTFLTTYSRHTYPSSQTVLTATDSGHTCPTSQTVLTATDSGHTCPTSQTALIATYTHDAHVPRQAFLTTYSRPT